MLNNKLSSVTFNAEIMEECLSSRWHLAGVPVLLSIVTFLIYQDCRSSHLELPRIYNYQYNCTLKSPLVGSVVLGWVGVRVCVVLVMVVVGVVGGRLMEM